MRISGDWFENKNTQAVCRVLSEAGYQALFVGGCVRNALIGAKVSDIDIATDATPQTVTQLCEKAGFKVVPTGIEHGTVTVVAGHVPHEITTFRHDVETDGRRAVIAFADNVTDDARRRDFTMNALYADASGQIIDPLSGLDDLKARRVRFIEDPVERIREDYLRTLRFFRFHAWYGDPQAGIDEEGLAAVAAHLDGLAKLSRERVGAEIKKLLRAPDPAPAVAAMRASGVLAAVLPGADDTALAPLVHAERQHQALPCAMRRLACLGGENLADRLRLSRKESAALDFLREETGTTRSLTMLAYRNGFDAALDVALLRQAVLNTPFSQGDLEKAKRAAGQVFPLKAKDLMPRFSGPALGRKLRELELSWVESGFSLDRKALLDMMGDQAE